MPRVPSQQFASVLPSAQPTEPLSVQANPAAFGGQFGQALQQTGQVLGQAGNGLAQDAVAYQNLDNQTEASKANNDIDKQAAAVEGSFLNLKGAAAYNGYDDAVTKLDQVRQDALNNASNPQVARMVDEYSRRTYGWTVAAMGRHAAQQRQVDAISTSEASVNSAINTAALNYKDDSPFVQAVGTIRDQVKNVLAPLNGWSGPVADQQIQNYVSSTVKGRLIQQALTDPIGAQANLQRMRGLQIPAVSQADDGSTNTVGALSAADAVQLEQMLQPRVDKAVAAQAVTTLMGVPHGSMPPVTSGPGVDNNGGNLRAGPNSFQSFNTPADGVAALVNQLRKYPGEYGATTINQIAEKWAPKGDGSNDPSAWASNVSAISGVAPDTPINFNDAEQMGRLAHGVTVQEKGAQKAGAVFTPDVIQQGVAAAFNGAQPAGGPSSPLSGPAADEHLASLVQAIQQSPMSENQKALAQAQLVQTYRESQAQLQAQLAPRLKAELASVSRTGDDLTDWSPDEVRRAYPEGADQILKQIQDAKAFQAATEQIKLNGPADDQKVLSQFTPQHDQDFQEKSAQYDALVKAIQAKNKAVAADPAGYVMQASPRLQQMLQDAYTASQSQDQTVAAQGPNKFAAALAYGDRMQAQLGVPADARTVLTNSQAQNIVGEIAKQPASQAFQTLQTMQKQYGGYWNRAFSDLVDAGLAPGYQVLASINPQDKAGGAAFAQALATPRKDLETAVGDAKQDIDQAVATGLQPLAQTLRYSRNWSDVMARYTEAGQTLAYQLTQAGAHSPQEAVSSALGTLLNNNYDFATGPGFAARVPKGSLAAVESTATAALARLSPADLAPLQPGAIGTATAQTPEQLRQAAFDTAKADPLWITNPNDDGLLLLNRERRPVIGTNGQPIGFRFTAAGAAPVDTAVAAPVEVPAAASLPGAGLSQQPGSPAAAALAGRQGAAVVNSVARDQGASYRAAQRAAQLQRAARYAAGVD